MARRARGRPLWSRRCGRPPFGYRSGQAFSKNARIGAPPVVFGNYEKNKPALYFLGKVTHPPSSIAIVISFLVQTGCSALVNSFYEFAGAKKGGIAMDAASVESIKFAAQVTSTLVAVFALIIGLRNEARN